MKKIFRPKREKYYDVGRNFDENLKIKESKHTFVYFKTKKFSCLLILFAVFQY
jgi:hypothetical protein